MLDPLGGKQQSSWFDSLSTSSTAMNSNSSGSSGSLLSLSSHLRDSSDALSCPTWLFNSQIALIRFECARQANSYWHTLGENDQQRTKTFDSMVQARFTWNGNIRSALTRALGDLRAYSFKPEKNERVPPRKNALVQLQWPPIRSSQKLMIKGNLLDECTSVSRLTVALAARKERKHIMSCFDSARKERSEQRKCKSLGPVPESEITFSSLVIAAIINEGFSQ
ncbi:unnamed protein product [Cylicocyclus nassatus]|uniref:Uncharacterized protein n=1 Tax=Cylicocyclus nassatus TaxID=53992 RepID=A0AA36GWA1_CYLNA|nr:unnamed protein product [Cylicocyclus nassatus]